MRSEQETDRALEQYGDMIRRICLCHIKNRTDTEDIFQTVFLKYLLSEKAFESEEHEKAWFIRVTLNACKDHLRDLFRRKETPLEVLAEEACCQDEQRREVLEAVMSLPQKYKAPIYLHYYEGCSAAEIAALLRSKENTVYSLLSRGRDLLKKDLGGDDLGE